MNLPRRNAAFCLVLSSGAVLVDGRRPLNRRSLKASTGADEFDEDSHSDTKTSQDKVAASNNIGAKHDSEQRQLFHRTFQVLSTPSMRPTPPTLSSDWYHNNVSEDGGAINRAGSHGLNVAGWGIYTGNLNKEWAWGDPIPAPAPSPVPPRISSQGHGDPIQDDFRIPTGDDYHNKDDKPLPQRSNPDDVWGGVMNRNPLDSDHLPIHPPKISTSLRVPQPSKPLHPSSTPTCLPRRGGGRRLLARPYREKNLRVRQKHGDNRELLGGGYPNGGIPLPTWSGPQNSGWDNTSNGYQNSGTAWNGQYNQGSICDEPVYQYGNPSQGLNSSYGGSNGKSPSPGSSYANSPSPGISPSPGNKYGNSPSTSPGTNPGNSNNNRPGKGSGAHYHGKGKGHHGIGKGTQNPGSQKGQGNGYTSPSPPYGKGIPIYDGVPSPPNAYEAKSSNTIDQHPPQASWSPVHDGVWSPPKQEESNSLGNAPHATWNPVHGGEWSPPKGNDSNSLGTAQHATWSPIHGGAWSPPTTLDQNQLGAAPLASWSPIHGGTWNPPAAQNHSQGIEGQVHGARVQETGEYSMRNKLNGHLPIYRTIPISSHYITIFICFAFPTPSRFLTRHFSYFLLHKSGQVQIRRIYITFPSLPQVLEC